MIRQARKIAGIGLSVMIRPRGGDFLFDDDEFAIMQADIDTAKAEGADCVVIGLLSADGTIDVERTSELIARARPLCDLPSGVRHDARSFRGAGDADRARRRPGADVRPGSERARRSAADHRAHSARRQRIIVMPGGGITARNAERIIAAAQPREIHFAALEPEAGGMQFRRQHVFMGGELRPPEYDRLVTSAAPSARYGKASG